jgi:hypothetical protein
MPADPEEVPSHTGVAGESSSFPSPSSSTDVPAGLNTDTDASANQGPLPPRLPQIWDHVMDLDVPFALAHCSLQSTKYLV